MRSWKKKLHPKLRAQVERAERLGCTLEQARGGHYAVRSRAGKRIAGLSASPSDHRTNLNEASILRRVLDDLEENQG